MQTTQNTTQTQLRRFYMRDGKRTVTVTYRRVGEGNKFQYAFSANRVATAHTKDSPTDLYNKNLGKEIAEGRLKSGKHCFECEVSDVKMAHLDIAKHMLSNTVREKGQDQIPNPVKQVIRNYLESHSK